jgi:hypothetical protein
MFLKGMLYLNSYNLAVTSDLKKREIYESDVQVIPYASDTRRLASIMEYDIVVDACEYTPQELRLLAMMGSQYPMVDYAPGSIYSGVNLASDALCILSSDEVVIEEGVGFGDPQNMYQVLVSIACKTGTIEDLHWAMSNSRGLCGWVDWLGQELGVDHFDLTVTKSVCYRGCLGEVESWRDYVGLSSNYFSTSKSLVCDVLISHSAKQAVYNEVESMGPLGPVGCPTKKPETDGVFNSNARDLGLKHGEQRINPVLAAIVTAGVGDIIAYRSNLKELSVRVAERMIARKRFTIPQLNFLLPYSFSRNNAWSVSRGWPAMPPDVRSKGARALEVSMSKHAMLWCLGAEKRAPRLGINAYGARRHELSTHGSASVAVLTEGTYRITKVEMWIDPTNMRGREDATALSGGSLTNSGYLGSVCTIVMGDDGKDSWLVDGETEDDPGHTVDKRIPDREEEGASSGPDDSDDSREVLRGVVKKTTPSKHSYNKRSEVKVAKIGRKVGPMCGDPNFRLEPDPTIPTKSGICKLVPGASTWEGAVGITKHLQVVPASGVGLQCALNSVTDDLVNHGHLLRSDVERCKSGLLRDLSTGKNHDMQEVAALLNAYNIGVEVYEAIEDESYRVQAFGTNGAVHNVRVLRSGNHFDSLVEPVDPFEGERYTIKHHSGSQTPAASAAALTAFKAWYSQK